MNVDKLMIITNLFESFNNPKGHRNRIYDP